MNYREVDLTKINDWQSAQEGDKLALPPFAHCVDSDAFGELKDTDGEETVEYSESA